MQSLAGAGALVSMFLIVGTLMQPSPAVAADAATAENYQVKLRVDDSVLDANGNLTVKAAKLFGIPGAAGSPGAPQVEQAVYVDTPDSRFAHDGWSVRFRHKEGKDKFDLTYKYRLQLRGNTLSEQSVDEALSSAKESGFDSADTNYDPQVDASYLTSTLDFSNKKSANCDTNTKCAFPAPDKIVDILDDKLPGKFTKQTRTTLKDAGAVVSQAITQRSWPVTVDEKTPADLEVTHMSGGWFVELTAETSKRADAEDMRATLTSDLEVHGILRHGDAFKTQLVLDGTL